MFAKAVQNVSRFTFPVIIACRYWNGRISCGVASFIVLNEEGWILTSCHILNARIGAALHQDEIRAMETARARLQKFDLLTEAEEAALLPETWSNPEWIRNYYYWWGRDGLQLKDVRTDELSDLAVGRLEPWNFHPACLPVFKNPAGEFLPGTSLCRLGYPLHNVSVLFNEENEKFSINHKILPIPAFPLDGIHTRTIIRQDDKSCHRVKFVEMTTPGLFGHSGGPIFDANGEIWALQSHTKHYSLDFDPIFFQSDNPAAKNQQFFQVGLGSHSDEIVSFLRENRIKFQLAPEPRKLVP